MTSWFDSLDPDIREVLEDAARDSRSRLFRSAHADDAGTDLDDMEPSSVRASGWQPAERHLLEHHREEVWHLVHGAFVEKLSRDPIASARSLTPSDRRRYAHLDSELLPEQAKHLLEEKHPEEGERSLLEALVGNVELEAIPYERFVEAGRSLFDNHSTRLLGSLVDLWAGRYEDVLKVAYRVTTESRRSDLVAIAYCTEGTARSHVGDHHEALIAFDRASRHDHGELSTLTSLLLAAVVAENQAAAIQASEQVEDAIEGQEEAWHQIVRQYQVLQKNQLLPNIDHRTLEALRDRSSPRIQEILHVLAD